MAVLAVDLASKFSAVCVLDEDGKVLSEYDSAGKSSFQLVKEIAQSAKSFDVSVVMVEDVPHGINKLFMVKSVLRLQGMLILALIIADKLDVTFFVTPNSWMKHFNCVKKRGQSDADHIEDLRSAAAYLGYTAPDLVADYIKSLPEGTKVLKKHTNPLEKSRTDYVAAFLIGQWLLATPDFLSDSGVQPPSI